MKKLGITLLIIAIITITAVASNQGTASEKYLRIHIRANSNSLTDQSVKYEIKDQIISHLTPFIIECKSKSDVISVLNEKTTEINGIINNVLRKNGFTYTGKMVVRNELFPTRVYGDFTLEEGFYDAVIVELGKAEGDNWWCVMYPPLCFAEAENLTYKSKIAELIQEFKQKYIKEKV
ncbi:MAG: stage II sporulation protein R [Clostridia bacterium]|nr:stage II sporulation protein R [Clostridia bacterium]